MKKIFVSIAVALIGMGMVFAQSFTMKTADGKAIANNDTVTVSGVIDIDAGNYDIKLYLELTNTTDKTLKFQPSVDISNLPEGVVVTFCAGSCFDLSHIPELEVEAGATFGTDKGMDIGCELSFENSPVVVPCEFVNVETDESLQFYVKFIRLKDVANENRELAGVSVYPNPADGLFNLNVPARAQVEIFSANGQVVRQMEVGAGQTSLQLNNAGIYFIRVRANGKQAVKRLVVR